MTSDYGKFKRDHPVLLFLAEVRGVMAACDAHGQIIDMRTTCELCDLLGSRIAESRLASGIEAIRKEQAGLERKVAEYREAGQFDAAHRAECILVGLDHALKALGVKE